MSRFLTVALLTALCCFFPGRLWAGAYVFAGEGNGVDLVSHPTGYTGSGGTRNVTVCIVPGSPNAAAMETPIRNAIDRYNLLVPTVSNVSRGGSNDVPSSFFDWESVFGHELGHCIGLAHPNIASESLLTGDLINSTKTTDGANNSFDTNSGVDGLFGSADDARGDDVNLHWFFDDVNNPLLLPSTPQAGTYTRDVGDLPSGDNFVANADRNVAAALGFPNTEAVMQQGTFFDEDQRALAADDVATLLHARTGLNRSAGNGDDYTVNLQFGGETANCDINVSFNSAQTGFAVCQLGGSFINGTNIRITSANTFYNEGFNWFFSADRIPFPGEDDITVAFGGSTSMLDGGGTSLLANDADREGDGLLLSSGTFFGLEHGNVTLNADGTFTYNHTGSTDADDRFVYRVCNDDGMGNETGACAHQYVNVDVVATGNTAPTPGDDAITVSRGGTATVLDSGQTSLLANDSDPDMDSLTIQTTPVSGPSNGSLTINGDGTFDYTHDGSLNASDAFDYRVCDDGAPSICATATVTVDVEGLTCSAPGGAIPDGSGSLADGLSATESGVLADLDVFLEIDHTFIGDLTVTLTDESTGTSVTLLDRPGLPNLDATFGCGNDDIEATLDDAAGTPAEDQCEATPPAMDGTFSPTGSLADFAGAEFSGDWTLTVADGVAQDTGTLVSWCLLPSFGNAPVANDDGPGGAFVVDEDGMVTLTAAQLVANDTDVEDTTPTGVVSLAGTPSNGSAADNGDQTFTFTHDGSEDATATFGYRVLDSDGQSSDIATVTLNVNAINDGPVGVDDGPGGSFVVAEGGMVTLDAATLTANDTDAEDPGMTPGGDVTIVGSTTNGSVMDNGDQTFTFTHDDSETDTASFQYTVADLDGASSGTVTVTLTVTPENDLPVANNDGPGTGFTVDEGGMLTLSAGTLKANDLDSEDGIPAGAVSIAGGSTNGAVVENSQSFTFTHDGSETPTASFQYQVADSDGGTSGVATVSLTVTLQNDLPVANDDGPGAGFTLDEGAMLTLNVADLVANDTDEEDAGGVPGGALTLVGTTANGSVVDNMDGTVTFTHDGSETVAGSFQYQVTDLDGGASGIATVSLDVTPQNDLPVAVDDGPGGVFIVEQAGTVTVTAADLTGNDTDGEDGSPGGTVTLGGVTTNGSVQDNGDATFTFTHDGSETSTGTFQYQVQDNDAATSDLATVTITVFTDDQPPTAADDGPGLGFTLDEDDSIVLSAADLTANDADAEDTVPTGPVSVTGVATNGGVVDNGNQTFTFTHDGSETTLATFQYQVEDSAGQPSNPATVSLTINPVNDRPVANNDGPGGAFSVRRGNTVVLNATTLIANDTDEEDGLPGGDVVLAGTVENGSAVDNGDQTFSFVHDGASAPTASFRYRVRDSQGATSGTATVTLSVTEQDAPTAIDDGPGGDFTVDEGGSVELLASALTANDTDTEDGVPTGDVSLGSETVNGAVEETGNQRFTFTHDGSESGTASFEYRVADSAGASSNLATVSLTVNPVNDAPTAVNDQATTSLDQPVEIDPLANDSDVDSDVDPGSVTITREADNGSTSVDPVTGIVTYTPDPGFGGDDSFDYTVADEEGLTSNEAMVTVSVGEKPVAACAPGGRRVRLGLPANIDGSRAFDGGPFTFTAMGLPASLTIDAASGLITGTPTAGDVAASPFDVTVFADDGSVQSVSFILTVDPDSDVAFYSSFEESCIGF